MKRAAITLAAATLGITAMAMGCSGEGLNDEGALGSDEFASVEAPLCNNSDGVRSVMTALAVAAGKEMHRWLPERDFQWNSSTSRLELSANAAPRCPNRKCSNTQAILDMQNDSANGILTYGNIPLSVSALKSALKKSWQDQMACNAAGTCSAESHDLNFDHAEKGSCDQKFFFDHYKMGTSTPLARPGDLVNKLVFLGYPGNTMLNFYQRDGMVSIDPTYGLNEGGVSSSGSCTAACTLFSATDAAGRCCACNGKNGTFKRSAFSALIYLCK